MRILYTLIVLSLPIHAYAGEISVEENPVPLNSFAAVKYKLAKGESVLWDVSPEPVKMVELLDADFAYLYFNGTQQKYKVTASIVNFDTKKFSKKRELVTIGEGGPIPPIPPGPVPPTPPLIEYETPVRLYIVEETSARTPAVARVIVDVIYWNELDSKGYVMRPYDVSSADSKRLGLDKIKQPLPFIVIAEKNGNVISSHPLPLTREGINKLLPPVKAKLNMDTYTIPSSLLTGDSCLTGTCSPARIPARRGFFR